MYKIEVNRVTKEPNSKKYNVHACRNRFIFKNKKLADQFNKDLDIYLTQSIIQINEKYNVVNALANDLTMFIDSGSFGKMNQSRTEYYQSMFKLVHFRNVSIRNSLVFQHIKLTSYAIEDIAEQVRNYAKKTSTTHLVYKCDHIIFSINEIIRTIDFIRDTEDIYNVSFNTFLNVN